jgi:hypothetical protein
MAKQNKQDTERLRRWRDLLATNDAHYSGEEAEMDRRERQYLGTDRDIEPVATGEARCKTPPRASHIRNVTGELIEAQIDSSIPAPKVTPQRPQDEELAVLIENMLRNEVDRMPFEAINDQMERTVKVQGGAAFLLEWDHAAHTRTSVGCLKVTPIHPKQIVPQAGVYNGIENMDYIFLKLPQTKEYIRKKYGVDVSDQGEEEPEAKSTDKTDTVEDMVTQYVAYYRNDAGGIGLFSWVCDTVLEDLEDYQARRLKRCRKCGAAEASGVEALGLPTLDGTPPPPDELREKDGACQYCGERSWESSQEEYEEVYDQRELPGGGMIPGAQTRIDEEGLPVLEPTRIPYYKPNRFPVVLMKNVSVFGRFLGDSDADKIRDQQNTIKRMSLSINDKLLKAGSYLCLPSNTQVANDAAELKEIRVTTPDQMAMIKAIDLQPDIAQDMAYMQHVYEEARQIIGITESFQGRRDTTATSGKAKEFAAAQSAGRLASKRVMKQAAFADLYQAMFQFMLAYADEPRPVVFRMSDGKSGYGSFDRYMFLKQDEGGGYYWDDAFLFSCDASSGLAVNREAMWQETRLNFQTGAFGNPQDINTLILFWLKMEQLHYPGAKETRAYLEMQQQQQMMQMQQQQMLLQELQRRGAGQVQPRPEPPPEQAAMPQQMPQQPNAGQQSLVASM